MSAVSVSSLFPQQGAVESIAMESAKERTKLFERISQSDEYVAQYEKMRVALQKAKDDTHFQFYKKRTATAERKQVSQERAEARQCFPPAHFVGWPWGMHVGLPETADLSTVLIKCTTVHFIF